MGDMAAAAQSCPRRVSMMSLARRSLVLPRKLWTGTGGWATLLSGVVLIAQHSTHQYLPDFRCPLRKVGC
jgi:hypothetical protein